MRKRVKKPTSVTRAEKGPNTDAGFHDLYYGHRVRRILTMECRMHMERWVGCL